MAPLGGARDELFFPMTKSGRPQRPLLHEGAVVDVRVLVLLLVVIARQAPTLLVCLKYVRNLIAGIQIVLIQSFEGLGVRVRPLSSARTITSTSSLGNDAKRSQTRRWTRGPGPLSHEWGTSKCCPCCGAETEDALSWRHVRGRPGFLEPPREHLAVYASYNVAPSPTRSVRGRVGSR